MVILLLIALTLLDILKTDGNGVLSLTASASGSFNNSTFTGNTILNNISKWAFNQVASAFNFMDELHLLVTYQGSSRHTANVSIRASLAVQQFEFTSNTGQTLLGSSDSQGLSYMAGSISVYKDGVKLREIVICKKTQAQ